MFAHRALRDLVLAGPLKINSVLASAIGEAFLAELWSRVGAGLPPEHRLPASGLSCVARDLSDGGKVIVVVLPPPERITEAWFVGFALAPSTPPTVRCFMLEKTIDFEGKEENPTVFAEWVGFPSPVHRNFGPGRGPEVDAFVELIEEADELSPLGSVRP